MYLSYAIKSRVYDSSDKLVGRLEDILIQPLAGGYDPLKFIVAQARGQQDQFIPFEFVANLSRGEVTLKRLMVSIPTEAPPGEYTWLGRDLLDEQIVDVEGARVVRVNDLKLGLFENQWCILGIDVSFKGILRRLKMERLDIFNILAVHLIDWRKAQPVQGALKLDTLSKGLTKLHPADLANIIEDLALKQGSTLVDTLDSKAAAKVVEEMDPEMQKTIISYLGPERAGDIVEQMSVDETVDLLKMLPQEQAARFLSRLQNGKLRRVRQLLTYADDSAGGLMTTEFVHAGPEWTVQQAIDEVKKVSAHFRSLLFMYVIDERGGLVGIISLRRLLTADPGMTIKQLVKSVPSASVLRPEQPVAEIMKVMTKYNLFTAAVVDDEHKLLGIVTIDDVMRQMVPNA